MIYSGAPSFFGFCLQDGHVLTFWLLLYELQSMLLWIPGSIFPPFLKFFYYDPCPFGLAIILTVAHVGGLYSGLYCRDLPL